MILRRDASRSSCLKSHFYPSDPITCTSLEQATLQEIGNKNEQPIGTVLLHRGFTIWISQLVDPSETWNFIATCFKKVKAPFWSLPSGTVENLFRSWKLALPSKDSTPLKTC